MRHKRHFSNLINQFLSRYKSCVGYILCHVVYEKLWLWSIVYMLQIIKDIALKLVAPGCLEMPLCQRHAIHANRIHVISRNTCAYKNRTFDIRYSQCQDYIPQKTTDLIIYLCYYQNMLITVLPGSMHARGWGRSLHIDVQHLWMSITCLCRRNVDRPIMIGAYECLSKDCSGNGKQSLHIGLKFYWSPIFRRGVVSVQPWLEA